MRALNDLPKPLTSEPEELKNTLIRLASELEAASQEERPQTIASDFSVTNYTETRAFDSAAASMSDIANVLATLIADLAKGGMNRE